MNKKLHALYLLVITIVVTVFLQIGSSYREKAVTGGAAFRHPRTGDFIWKDDVIVLKVSATAAATNQSSKPNY